ncbi:hypothetical protein B0H14DRAFT_3465666 [Mycena olivaceomarginata]|nr:hypothetical protein B0H14DRAFT_3465666 [Mycena olivaceomarginata]
MPNGDIVMSEEVHPLLINTGPKSYKPAARGWTKELVRANHKDEVIKLLNANPDTCVAVVILASDFFDRDRGGAEHVTSGKGMSMPWTNTTAHALDVAVFDGLTDLTKSAEFKQALLSKFLADPVVTQMVDNDHSSVPGYHQHVLVFKVILHFAEVGTYTVRRRTLTIWKRA